MRRVKYSVSIHLTSTDLTNPPLISLWLIKLSTTRLSQQNKKLKTRISVKISLINTNRLSKSWWLRQCQCLQAKKPGTWFIRFLFHFRSLTTQVQAICLECEYLFYFCREKIRGFVTRLSFLHLRIGDFLNCFPASIVKNTFLSNWEATQPKHHQNTLPAITSLCFLKTLLTMWIWYVGG